MSSRQVSGVSNYPFSTFESLHSLPLGKLMFVNECTVNLLSSHRLCTGESQKVTRVFFEIQVWVHRGCIHLLRTMKKNKKFPDKQFGVPKKAESLGRDRTRSKTAQHEMLPGKLIER